MAAAGRSSLRKVDAFDDQQVLGLRGERIHRLARTEQAAEVTGHCRPKALRLHATRAAHEEGEDRLRVRRPSRALWQTFEEREPDRDRACAVQECAPIDYLTAPEVIDHLPPPTCVRNASLLTNASITCLSEPPEAWLTAPSASTVGRSTSTMSRSSA